MSSHTSKSMFRKTEEQLHIEKSKNKKLKVIKNVLVNKDLTSRYNSIGKLQNLLTKIVSLGCDPISIIMNHQGGHF